MQSNSCKSVCTNSCELFTWTSNYAVANDHYWKTQKYVSDYSVLIKLMRLRFMLNAW